MTDDDKPILYIPDAAVLMGFLHELNFDREHRLFQMEQQLTVPRETANDFVI
jgi:hypothetical protein